MPYRVERALETDQDLASIFAFLLDSYVAFGEEENAALERAAARIRAIESAMLALGNAPDQGTLRPDLLPRLRSVTKQRAIFYFEVDDALSCVRVLAIFFGGQDHQNGLRQRLSGPD